MYHGVYNICKGKTSDNNRTGGKNWEERAGKNVRKEQPLKSYRRITNKQIISKSN